MPLNSEMRSELLQNAAAQGIERIVVAAVIRDGDKALLLERSRDDYLGGLFELPSGVVETGETLDAALRREVAEETGFALIGIDCYLGCFDYRSRGGRWTRQFNFAVTVKETPVVTLSEHASFAWVGLDGLAEYPVSPEVGEVLRRALASKDF